MNRVKFRLHNQKSFFLLFSLLRLSKFKRSYKNSTSVMLAIIGIVFTIDISQFTASVLNICLVYYISINKKATHHEQPLFY